MQLRELTVRIEYRHKAGNNRPRFKELRARVVMRDADHEIFGSDLFFPNVTSVDLAIVKCLSKLDHVEIVRFTFDEAIGIPDRAFKNGRIYQVEIMV